MKTERTNLFTLSLLSEKEKKSLEILDLLSMKETISRTEISKITGINIVSISNYIKHYIDKKLILETGLDASTGGRKPELMELNEKGVRVIGLDIGNTALKVVMTDLGLNILEKAETTVPDIKDVETEAVRLIEEVVGKHGILVNDISVIGIGGSGDNAVSLASALEKRLGTKSFVGDEIRCAAFGEKRLGSGTDVKNFLYIYSDLGRGVVIKDNEYLETGNPAGEARFSENADSGIALSEKLKYLSPWNESFGITYVARKEVSRGIGTKIVALANGQLGNITQEVVMEAAKQNDEVASGIVENAGINLGLRIAYLVNLFSPQVVILGGGVEASGDFILNPIRKMVRQFAFAKYSNAVKIMPAVLGKDAVSLGAAALGIREIFLRT